MGLTYDFDPMFFPENSVYFGIAFYNSYLTHPETSSRGGGGLTPEMIQVCDYDILIVLVELNTLI